MGQVTVTISTSMVNPKTDVVGLQSALKQVLSNILGSVVSINVHQNQQLNSFDAYKVVNDIRNRRI